MMDTLKPNFELPDYLVVSGSRLYGTNREDSDWDYRGFLLPPTDYLLDGGPTFEYVELEGDHKLFSAKKFLQLALIGDPQCTEMFFVPEDKVKHISPVGEIIIGMRELIVSNKIYNRIMGYSNSEWRKALGEKMVQQKRTKTQDDVIADIRNTFGPDKSDMDDIIEILDRNRPAEIVPSLKNLGQKRRKEFEESGYGVSSAAHSIRLCGELTELMLTGNISFPRPDADLLRDMRQGKVSKEDAVALYEETRIRADEARAKSVLPDEPDRKLVESEYLSLVKGAVVADYAW